MSDNISPSKVRLGLIPALTDNILRLQQTPVTRKRQLSPQSEISRLNEEKERSKRRRDENKKQKLANQPAPEPINILVANQYINIYEMTVIQIKDYLKEKKVNTSGNKAQLIDKIKTVN